MGYKKTYKKIKLPKLKPYIIFIGTMIIIYMILSSTLVTKKYNLRPGDIARFDIKASRDVEDKISTQKNIEEELKHIQELYTYDANVRKNAIQNIEGLFMAVEQVNNDINFNIPSNEAEISPEKRQEAEDKVKNDKIKLLKEKSPIKNLSVDNYNILLILTKSQIDELKNSIIQCGNNLFDSMPIHENNTEEVSKAQGYITTYFNNTSFSKNLKELAMSIGYSQVKTTYFIDHKKTEESRQEVIKNVKPVIIKKDQTIISEGQPISENQIEILNELGLLDNNKSFSINLHLALIIIVVGIIGLQWIYMKGKCKEIYEDNDKLLVINILTIFTIIVGRAIVGFSPYVIPFACVPILLCVLINDRISLIISILNVVFMAYITEFSVDVILIALINSIVAPILLKRVQQRNDILYTSVAIGAINILFATGIGYFLNTNVPMILKRALFTGLAGIISGILAIGILPFLENIFHLVTNIKLLELANPNNPLIKRLLLEAPGTYHHSVLVANLSEMAAEKVGANPILTRVAAYYHDVGKLERPYYFKENQLGMDNPHDDITPSLSALIIISHVDDGVKLGEKYGLPKAIIDVIAQHHGDSLVKYFYITMRNNSEHPDEVKEEDYKYRGPAPISKEAALVMMADSVEAAVRSISNPTKEKVESMVNNIIKGKIDDNQLINSDLTFKDIESIRESFLKVLTGIYHERIEYPKEKLNNENKEKE